MRQYTIELDNTEFKNKFNAYTDNNIMTFQLLTSDILEQLKECYEKYGMLFEFLIKENKLYARIETGLMFESINIKNTLNKEDTFIYYSVLNFTLELLKKIYNIIESSEI